MKVYIVEMYGWRGSHRCGVYSNIESARNKLQEIFEEEKERCSKYENDYKVEWSKLFVTDCFYVKYGNSHKECYEITEVEVED